MIPVNRPIVNDQAHDNVYKCLSSGWLSQGGYVREFERKWAAYCDRKYAVAVNSGTVALEAALYALELPHGSGVVMPSLTIMSCASAAIRNGLTPVFVDVDADTWCVNPDEIEKAITTFGDISAIMTVDLYGQPCDYPRIVDIASRYNIPIIEDAAQAHGSTLGSRRCGSFGAVSCFSFYGNKVITTGEGGMVVTDDEGVEARVRSHINLCFGNGHDRYTHTGIGTSNRLSNIQAALGCAQIDGIYRSLCRKQEIHQRYITGLAERNIMDHRYMVSELSNCLTDVNPDVLICWQCNHDLAVSNYWANALLLPSGYNSTDVVRALLDLHVESRPFFTPLHKQEVLRGVCRSLPCPVSEMLSSRGLYLPSGVGTTDREVDESCDALVKVLGRK